MTLVTPEITEEVVETAKKAGATGNVIVPARGSGINETKFLGISVDDKTDIIFFVVEEHSVNKILNAINNECDLRKPGNGIAIVLSIDNVVGLERQVLKIKEKLKGEQL
jgi:nitrogen regulatory protein PII